MATPALGEGLARLQSGESDFDLGGGTFVQFSGIPEGQHNVLRDLQQSPLGKKANQLEGIGWLEADLPSFGFPRACARHQRLEL